MDHKFEIEFLDHVALRVKDLNASAEWYQEVFRLKKYQLPAWGEFPIFLLAGKSGIALFPAQLEDSALEQNSRHVKIDHFAFHVRTENLKKRKRDMKN